MNSYLYFYRVLLPSGETKTGFSQFAFEREFSAQLWLERRHKAIVLSLFRCPGWLHGLTRFFAGLFSPAVTNEDLSGLLRDLSLMMRGGVPMIDGLRTIAGEAAFGAGRGVSVAADLLYEELEGGATVSQAFSRHPDLFPEVVCNLVDIGNESGTLDRMFLEASAHLERLATMGRDARRALIYPAFVFFSILAAAVFWLYYVIPGLSDMFRQFHAKMPALTVAVLRFSEWMHAHFALSASLLLLLILIPWIAFRHNKKVRNLAFALGHRLPISGLLLRTSGMAFFTEHLALLIRAGLNMLQSLDILERATTDEYYREAIGKIRRVVERGEHLSAAMRATNRFPPLSLRMIAVGETTGTLDEQLGHLAQEYRRRLSHVIASLSEIIKPVIILAAGAFFIFVIVALLLPVYDLIGQVMSGAR
ncbi:MAG: type II secretion system F family protein [Candidatus Accumulibacter sp.]|jgi:general secretion pathway protein F/type IV pilus assembly protein PilC|nr:type II secretion system F family protein [Accumulibacter sp.]